MNTNAVVYPAGSDEVVFAGNSHAADNLGPAAVGHERMPRGLVVGRLARWRFVWMGAMPAGP